MKVNVVIAFMRVRIYKTTIILYFSGNCRSRSFQFACYDNERCDIEKEQCVDIIFRATAWITLPQRRLLYNRF